MPSLHSMQNIEPNVKSTYYLSDNIFFLVEQGKIIVWNYKSHEQYELEEEYFNELLHVSKHQQFNNKEIFTQLLESGLITNSPDSAAPWGWDILSKIFHIGTSDACASLDEVSRNNFASTYIEQCRNLTSNEYKPFSDKTGKLITLPKPDLALLKTISFYDAVSRRKTCRNFQPQTISLELLSTILFMSFGLIHGEWDELSQQGLEITGIRKAAPSAGGVHAEEIYVTCFRVNGQEQGLYHYRPQDHKLTLLTAGDFEEKIIAMN